MRKMKSPERESGLLRNVELKKKRLNLGLSIFLLLSSSRFLSATNTGSLLGKVWDEEKATLENVRVTASSKGGFPFEVAYSDKDGFFQLCGLPPGEYSLSLEREGYISSKKNHFSLEPSRVFYLEAVLIRAETGTQSPPHLKLVDLSDMTAETVISDFQIEALPSANNIWSIIENQDLSATTNRIDVGGMWSDIPALSSSRGSSSWTQTTYLLNGMDVTDPYWRGMPLFYPDLFSLSYIEHSNARHPVSRLSPGGYFDLTPKEGNPESHVILSAFATAPWMTTSNITSRLEAEGLYESHQLNSLQDIRAQFSGPILPGRLFFFTSLCSLHLNRNIAEFEEDDRANIFSGLVNLTYCLSKSSFQFFWTGQVVSQPTYGAARRASFSSTLQKKNKFNVLQMIWKTRFKRNHSFQMGASLSSGHLDSNFQENVTEPHGEDLFTKMPSGAAALAGREGRSSFVFLAKGDILLGSLAGHHHRLEYGFSLQQVTSSAEKEIRDDIHLHFYNGEPLEVIRFNTPILHRERALHLNFFAQETLTFPNLASLSFGLHLVSSRGWVPQVEGGKINWLNFSPRLGFAVPLLQDKSLTFRGSAGRYYFHLPLFYLTYGNSQALGGLAFPWMDRNNDLQFQPDEQGTLWRREGPFYAQIDPDINRPHADEYSLSVTQVFKNGLCLTLAGFYRETRRLIETLNVGVPLSSYDPVEFYDPGDDTIPGTPDDLNLIVYEQKKETLGQDFFLLTVPEQGARVSRYRGLDLTLVKKFSRRAVLFVSLTATEAIGTSSPGNTEWENDDGIIGSLYDSPNASIFARGRLRYDRAYTGRIGVSLPIPLGFRLASLVKYYDGQPFARKIIVSGLSQGPFYIQASSRGKTRYEFNMTVDIRLEKIFVLGGARARLILDGFNIFNWALATEENEWTGPEFPLRFATEVQSPRVFRLGFSYEF